MTAVFPKAWSYSSGMFIRFDVRLWVLALFVCCWGIPLQATGEEISYRVRFLGVEDRTLLNDLKSVSDMLALRRRSPPGSMRQLQRRAQRDASRFKAVLRSHGFYDADIEVDVRPRRRFVRVRYDIDPGKQYTIQRLDVVVVDATDDPRITRLFRDIKTQSLQEPGRAPFVLQIQDRLVRRLEQEGHPFAQKVQRRVEIEHGRRAMYLHFELERGPLARYGPVEFSGLNRVRPDLIHKTLSWEEGDVFDGTEVRAFQRRVMDLGLFSSARIIRDPELTADGLLPLQVEFAERKHRSLMLGGGYRSDEGALGRIGFEHRNLRGMGERLSSQFMLSEQGYGSESRYVKTHFRRLDQNLSVSLRAADDNPDAFRSRTVGTLVAVDRPILPNTVGSVGIGFRYASVRDIESDSEFGLLYIPVAVDWDGSDDVFDPRRGGRISLSFSPYRDMIDSEVAFTKARLSATRYQRLMRRPQLDAAARIVFGQIAGAARDSIPADERLYAGGGGSVRGYAYQSVGPLEGTRPLGGKSLLLASAELRWRWENDLGFVVFADGGVVNEAGWPEDFDEILWGIGGGFRYFTPVGPLRFDLAFPMERRPDVDDSFQFYISLGQAF